jgi:FAD/FMN-containing dehydrogenase/Fe-S oxidoreductase
LIEFARLHQVTLIPRAAGTSLAGQVVGSGIVTDISKHFNRILEVNKEEKWVRVQPGIIRDDLNHYLREYGLLFGPETSTASRAMIGGMIGNNSCGLHSIVWGAVRDHLLEVTVLLSDGSEAVFKQEDILAENSGFKKNIYKELYGLLSDEANQQLIRRHFPKSTVVRRNSGYALDSLVTMSPFVKDGPPFNLCKLLAGSGGTLAFVTEAKLHLLDLPPKETALVCIHTRSVGEALKANLIALRHQPMASELVDKNIMDFTIEHPEYHKNRFFIEGDPAAVLMVEFMEETKELVTEKAVRLIADLENNHYGYAYPVLYNEQTVFAWDIRKAGLGLLRNLRGETQPVNLIEDCAVAPEDLPDYISDLQLLLAGNGVKASYYAHAGAGELHVEPGINLKTKEGVVTFRKILQETVELVKKYNGSLSGEHGDGRLRGEFIGSVVGEDTLELFKKIKHLFDPYNIFNAGKIVDTPRMDTHLRYSTDPPATTVTTTFDFSSVDGILRLAEKCSGSGDCRKTEISGGLMCPSYMATRMEKDTTRARANILRRFLSNYTDTTPFNHREIKEVMDLCLSCKGCKIECPSSVDITKMKAEFLQQYYDINGVPFRSKLIANFSLQMKMASRVPMLYNFVYGNQWLRRICNKIVGFHPDRSIPLLPAVTLRAWFKKRPNILVNAQNTGVGSQNTIIKPQSEIVESQSEIVKPQSAIVKSQSAILKPQNISERTPEVQAEQQSISGSQKKRVYFFCDEFTNYYDAEIGKKAILLLEALEYEVFVPDHLESGRTYLSKGMVKKAAVIANENIVRLSAAVPENVPIVGVEPSAILTLRDEYIDLAEENNKGKAKKLARQTFTIEEFITAEFNKGNISAGCFTRESRSVVVHGHCYQKALSSQQSLVTMLSIPENYQVQLIPSGCCGMAGAFGYEAEHYEVSQKVGELVLFPAIRKLPEEVIIAASGTSCRHQIKDGTHKIARHPVEILWEAYSPG